ncbi:MAG: hypothetical protein LPL00_05780 [Alphaproteobacteria bacterium]|nr:hypothetical protein [Alphaproteobacteria bacterium]MDX5369048.1 hypothetical protein [Alphaproteobacteria bacterium]MDX5463752.1 hypothetical protein [Alphaproteobacteria bacterium]
MTGAGDDYIVGGRGSDRISGGAGNDVLKGGAGTVLHNGVMDTFVFDRGAIGHDRIVDFEAGVDRLEFKVAELPGISSASDIMGSLGSNADGDAVFDFGALGSITLEGVQAGQVDASSLLLV